MDAAMTMPIVKFTEMADGELADMNGEVNWSQYWFNIAIEAIKCGVTLVDYITGISITSSGFIAAESTLG